MWSRNPVATRGVTYSQAEIDYYTNYGGTPFLDCDYTVFGMVTEGLEIVDKIARVQKDERDRPLEDIKMKVSIIK